MEIDSQQPNRRFIIGLIIILIAILVSRLLILDEFLNDNPFSEVFFSDDWVYWVMAGSKAAGHWIEETPFLSAPLFPYLLGLLRYLGGELHAVYISQLILGIASILLIAFGTKNRFGINASLIATALFAFSEEPAISFTRVMADSIQIFLVTLVWYCWSLLSESEKPTMRGTIITAMLIGLLTLAWPPAQLLLLAYAIWLFLWDVSIKNLIKSVIAVCAGVLIIGVATLHNYSVDGEFVMVSANSGINLLQGNNKNSEGIITPIEGIRTDRQHMYEDMAQVYENVHGKRDHWKIMDDYYKKQAWDFILSEPDKSIPLFAKKFYWFLSSSYYDNISILSLEQEHGLFQRAKLTPIELPWLMGLSLLGIIVLLKNLHRYSAELLILAVTIFTCVLFHYSARYRLPAAPIIAILAAVAITHWRRISLPPVLKFVIVFLPLLFILINQKTGFANVDFMRKDTATKVAHSYVEIGDRRVRNSKYNQAIEYYEKAVQADPNYQTPALRLADLAIIKNSPALIKRWVKPSRSSTETILAAQKIRYNILLADNKYSEAAQLLEELNAAYPGDRQVQEKLIFLLISQSNLKDNNSEKSLKLAKKLLANSPGQLRIDGLRILAVTQFSTGNKSAANISLKKAMKMAERTNAIDQIANLKKLQGEVDAESGSIAQIQATPFETDSPWDLSRPHPMDLLEL